MASAPLVFGFDWTSDSIIFELSGVVQDISSWDIASEWTEINKSDVLLSPSTAAGTIAKHDPTLGKCRFVLLAADTLLLAPVNENRPGVKRRFDVKMWRTDTGGKLFLCNLEAVGQV